jgi:hypothetical protein
MPNRNETMSDTTGLVSMPTQGGRVQITLFQYNNGMFVNLVDEVYALIQNVWFDTTRTEMPLSLDEFRLYSYMAARTRISRVNNERRDQWPLRTNDVWAIPTFIAQVINSVGRVFDEATASEIVPVWPSEPALPGYEVIIDAMNSPGGLQIVTDMQIRLTMRIKRIESHIRTLPGVPVLFVEALAGERNGDPDVMCLVPAYSSEEDGELGEEPERLHTRGVSDRAVNGTVAFTYLAWAMWPSVYRRNTVDTHPLENPGGRYITTQAIKATWMRLLTKAI